jgi:hypothetical protein
MYYQYDTIRLGVKLPVKLTFEAWEMTDSELHNHMSYLGLIPAKMALSYSITASAHPFTRSAKPTSVMAPEHPHTQQPANAQPVSISTLSRRNMSDGKHIASQC